MSLAGVRARPLREIGSEVDAEGREWTRQRLQQRLQEEAARVVADIASWVWNLARDRWASATGARDLYHAAEHLRELGPASHVGDETATARWVGPPPHAPAPPSQQRQCRFKRPGQFWTPGGLPRLGVLSETCHNLHREELWPAD